MSNVARALVVVCASLTGATAAKAAPPPTSFGPPATFAVGPHPIALAVADVGRHGKLDLIVGDNSKDGISVLLGRGDGTFQTRKRSGSVAYVTSVALVDASLNGTPDILAISGQQLAFLENRGGGSFNAAAFSDGQFFAFPYPLAIADLNRDGKLDVISGNDFLGLTIGLGNGKGHFSPFFPASRPDGFAQNVAVADIDRDGIPDLIASSLASSHTGTNVFRGRGDGSFDSTPLLTAGAPGVPLVADLSFDARPDLIVTRGSEIAIYLNKYPQPFAAPVVLTAGHGVTALVVADVNRDGKPDLVVAEDGDSAVSVFAGNGNGTFQPRQTFAVAGGATALAVADVNADGVPDVVVTNRANTVSVLLGRAP